MKHVTRFDDLRPFGIDALTGEACGLGYRILCDVTAKGKRILEKMLGCELKLAENWNHGTEDNPHIGSAMLAHELLIPIGVFGLLESGCTEVWIQYDGGDPVGLLGFEPGDAEHVKAYEEYYEDRQRRECGVYYRRLSYAGDYGDRNQHQMSGRVR